MSKRILITGATRGLGRALTAAFAAQGHVVLGCGRALQQILALRAEYASPHHFAAVDVGDDAQVAAWIAEVLPGGPPDLVINNAALMNQPAPLWEIPAAEFDALTRANINGTANVLRHIVPALVKMGQGVIVNFSSGWGRSTAPEVAPYCASKWAIEGLTKSLAQELPEGLAAVALNPGVIDTEMLRTCWADGAASSPKPEQWAKKAAPFILALGAKDNGKSLTVS